MSVLLDPYRLATVKLMPSDVQSAIAAQNVEVSAGQIGADPPPEGQQLNATVTARARLQTPEQFRNIIVDVDFLGEGDEEKLTGRIYRIRQGVTRYPTPGTEVSTMSSAAMQQKYPADE